MWRTERGVALLEVLAATVILSVTGLGLVQLTAGATHALRVAAMRERELADEERLLTAYTLLSATGFDRRLGTRDVGPYRVSVQRPEPHLYRVAIARTSAPATEDLVTVVLRQEADSAR
jgi:type II secretory pathway component PulJ